MPSTSSLQQTVVKVYNGFGHKHMLTLYGHVRKNKFTPERSYNNNILSNILHLVRLFFVVPLEGVRVQLKWNNQQLYATTQADGFFKFEWESTDDVPAGSHQVSVEALSNEGDVVATGTATVFVPHITQYGFISDIDDTVMISHSATVFKRLRTLFTRDPRTRKVFATVSRHYRLLAHAHTTPDVPNPFFYVSSSEWNLYDDLVEFFKFNELPPGAFLLSQLKRWYQLFKTGKTKHEGKLLRIFRILHSFPNQRFILLGDNSQADPTIYRAICQKYPKQIFGVYIRIVVANKVEDTKQVLKSIEDLHIFTCLFEHNEQAIEHSKTVGLIV